MTTIEESDNALWDISVGSKSWVELVEEEDDEFAEMNDSSKQTTPVKDDLKKVDINKIRSPVKQADLEDSLLPTKNDSIMKKSTEDTKLVASDTVRKLNTVTEIEDTKAIILPIIKEESPGTDPPLKNVTQTYANILKSPEEAAEGSRKIEVKPEVKKELNKEFLHDEISLTGHLDGFKLNSPAKPSNEGFKTPNKPLKPTLRSSPRLTKRKILDGISESSTEESLKPSPSKIARTAPHRNRITPIRLPGTPVRAPGTPTFIKKEVETSFEAANRKRPRDSTPNVNRRYQRKEQETDPEVLARRQKQIDYGKNTIGYERYREQVPKESRQSIHPKTPPLRMKYSRRAWDGLVRIWRQRLHFWDPPSEGGGDPALLEEFSDVASEVSEMSDTGSLPSTPVQDWKRRAPSSPLVRATRQPHRDEEDMEDDFQNQGCCPLPAE